MNIEKLTQRAQEAIASAQETAIRRHHQQVDGEHLHFALITQEDGLIPRLLGIMSRRMLRLRSRVLSYGEKCLKAAPSLLTPMRKGLHSG